MYWIFIWLPAWRPCFASDALKYCRLTNDYKQWHQLQLCICVSAWQTCYAIYRLKCTYIDYTSAVTLSLIVVAPARFKTQSTNCNAPILTTVAPSHLMYYYERLSDLLCISESEIARYWWFFQNPTKGLKPEI